jgi:BON domain-containing protein
MSRGSRFRDGLRRCGVTARSAWRFSADGPALALEEANVRRILKIAAAIAAAGLTLATALLLFPRMRARRRTGPDLSAIARGELEAAFGEAAGAIQVRAEDGIVTLRGEVDEMGDIARYESVVRAIPGVAEVDNLIRLRLIGVAKRATAPA